MKAGSSGTMLLSVGQASAAVKNSFGQNAAVPVALLIELSKSIQGHGPRRSLESTEE
jgi:hypothetical protein